MGLEGSAEGGRGSHGEGRVEALRGLVGLRLRVRGSHGGIVCLCLDVRSRWFTPQSWG